MNRIKTINEIECHECALEVNIPTLIVGKKAKCPRCGFVLTAHHANANDRIVAFSITALIFLIVSIPFEFLSFQSGGLENSFSIISSFSILMDNNYAVLAFLQLVTIVVIPAILLLSLLFLLIPLRRGSYPLKGHRLFKLIFKLMPWSMVEIFLIGVLVSLVKIIAMADVQLGSSFYAFVFFSISMTSALLHIDKTRLQKQLNQARNSSIDQSIDQSILSKSTAKPKPLFNKSDSIQHTWALIITSIVLYIPANSLPIMNTRLLGQDDPSTILGGVILLWNMGSYPIALIIFIASVAVPVAKILALAWLNYSVQFDRTNLTNERIKLYRIAEFVGRWSMVDVFVVIILASLIQLGNTISIYPGSATIAFSGVVIITMLAAMSFDSHLIWKSSKPYEQTTNA